MPFFAGMASFLTNVRALTGRRLRRFFSPQLFLLLICPLSRAWCGKPSRGETVFQLSFPYVCPEPVLVKCSFIYIDCSKRQTFAMV